MPQARRSAFLTWAEHNDAWIIEDDYDSEFRYAGQPIPALASLDAHGRTLYVGSFSKVFSHGLRLGFVVVPHAHVARFREILRAYGAKASITPLKRAHMEDNTVSMSIVSAPNKDRLNGSNRSL